MERGEWLGDPLPRCAALTPSAIPEQLACDSVSHLSRMQVGRRTSTSASTSGGAQNMLRFGRVQEFERLLFEVANFGQLGRHFERKEDVGGAQLG
jgi:hypothetical protein